MAGGWVGRRQHTIAFGVACAILAACPRALAADPAAALEQLKSGYALKMEGRCAEAIPHFVESQRLDPQPKTLLNLADCEERLGDLVSAQQHAVEARDEVRREGNAALVGVAEQQLARLDKRLPRLTVRVVPDAPAGTTVARDGTTLGSVSLGVALPTNPGKHLVVASAPGRPDQRFAIDLAEGAQEVLDVRPGELAAAPGPATPAETPDGAASRSTWGVRKTIAVALGGAGLVGIGIGSYFGMQAIAKNDQSKANGHCDATGCDSTGKPLRSQALTDAGISTVAFGVALAAIAGGVVLWVTAPSSGATPATSGHAIEIAPAIGADRAGVTVRGGW
jgi:hypothetical protein